MRKKQQLERQQREGQQKYLGGQKNSNSGRQGGGQTVAQENRQDAGHYGTFGRQGQGQYQGQQKRDW
jgi:hypothetical protein